MFPFSCLQTPSCESLGYTQTSCVDNNGVKCPFGNKYFCVCPAKYVYSCSGTGYAGGKGTACGGKYTECICASGYVWKNGSCKKIEWGTCTGLAAHCYLGDILFSDGTCSADVVDGKTPIAVVVYKSGNCGQAMALDSVGGTYYYWSTEYVDISGLTNYSSSLAASQDFASCENSAKIRAQGNSSTYPAVWAAYNYTTTETKAGDWCLPAAGIFTSIYNNQSTINTGFRRAGGKQFTTSPQVWSSSGYSKGSAWRSLFSSSYGLLNYAKGNRFVVRPVLEF